MAYFPLFVDLADKDCLVAGGGKVATRKVRMLLDFEARVFVVAKEICKELKDLSRNNDFLYIEERAFADQDILDKTLVIAATDDVEVNNHISRLCKKMRVPVNVADQIEESSFILSSYLKQQNVVAAFSSGGYSPVLTQYLKNESKAYLTKEIGEINECLGKNRKRIQMIFPAEEQRKEVFRSILMHALSNACIPTDKEIEEIISLIKSKYEI
ncbi:MAG: bifunctional precorrin-2 dehydrogenase/sirohydrochlorin ferrochelatase [Lachnospiraceae bacterium]